MLMTGVCSSVCIPGSFLPKGGGGEPTIPKHVNVSTFNKNFDNMLGKKTFPKSIFRKVYLYH